jgi:hypothetical protein
MLGYNKEATLEVLNTSGWLFVRLKTTQYNLLRGKRQKRNIARSFNGKSYLPLMLCTITGNTTRQNLPAFCCKPTKLCSILVVDMIYFVHAERADLTTGLATPISFHHFAVPPY